MARKVAGPKGAPAFYVPDFIVPGDDLDQCPEGMAQLFVYGYKDEWRVIVGPDWTDTVKQMAKEFVLRPERPMDVAVLFVHTPDIDRVVAENRQPSLLVWAWHYMKNDNTKLLNNIMPDEMIADLVKSGIDPGGLTKAVLVTYDNDKPVVLTDNEALQYAAKHIDTVYDEQSDAPTYVLLGFNRRGDMLIVLPLAKWLSPKNMRCLMNEDCNGQRAFLH